MSIAMATFNGGNYLEEQLASLEAQTVPPHEIVVCDDRSTDQTLNIISEFINNTSLPVKVYQNWKNLGYAENFLKAASLCTGDWIAFCDQDDVWKETKLEKVQNAITKDDSLLLVTHPAELIDERGASLNLIAWPSKRRRYSKFELSPWRSGMGCGQVFKACLVKEISYTQRFLTDLNKGSVSAHDDWVLKLSQCLGPALYLADPLVLRRRHPQSVTAKNRLPVGGCAASISNKSTQKQLRNGIALVANRSQVLKDLAESASTREMATDLQEASRYYEGLAKTLSARAAWRQMTGTRRYLSAVGVFVRPTFWTRDSSVAGARGFVRDLLDLFRTGAA